MKGLKSALLCIVSMVAATPLAAEDVALDLRDARHFTLKVLPVLREKCFGCHGANEADIKGGYDVRTRDAIIRGGESEEPAVVPGSAAESPLFRAVSWDGLEMPPKENDRLTPEQVGWIRQWIDAGATWPDQQTQQRIVEKEREVEENEFGILVSTSGGLDDQWTFRRYQKEEVWAFRPLRDAFEFHSVDGFVNARLKQAGIAAAPLASPEQLIRRATFDLTGLPPSQSEIADFLMAWGQDQRQAWSDLIDQLLDSPHYGERWAQHWLDVVRYADTAGFSNDYERSNAWRYRDYVIRSLNRDKPYDQFVQEQIAGDELRPGDPEAIVATGFLRMGPWGTAMIPQDEARQLYRDDVVNGIGQAFLSIPMRCCKCHDHKFDPIPTRDYYRIYAAVSATQPAEMPAEFLPEENQRRFEEEAKTIEELYQFASARVQALQEKQESAARKWYEEHNLAYKSLNDRKDDPDDEKPPRHCGLTEVEQGRLKVREQDEWIWGRRRERFQPLAQSVFNGKDLWQNGRKLRPPKQSNPNWKPESFVLMGGALTAKGGKVTPGVLSGPGVAASPGQPHDPYALTTDVSGRRLGLAQWIANPDNPLTARSLVNRLWQHHFGAGIVRTANNFGAKGAPPTHPELLDWLAREFIAGGWKMKRMHKLIMMSDAYRRSTRHPDLERLGKVDPGNKLLGRFSPRRLSAEEFRDALLAATGELNREMGGLPVMPEINMEVALQPRMIQFSIAPAHQPSRTPDVRNRRTIYAYRVRGQADPFLEVMNQPTPNDSCECRDSAAVSPQAFTLLNSDVMSDRSIALAVDLREDAEALPEQIVMAFQRVLGRMPSKDEHSQMLAYVHKMVSHHQEHQPERVEYPTEVVRSLVEEFSGKPFDYVEILPVFRDYVPDVKPWMVDPRTRAVADMCLLLFNTNEFAYVY